ncbi:MAG: hypothetical protein ACKO37_06860 [Vampirovibrionales bacterium]
MTMTPSSSLSRLPALCRLLTFGLLAILCMLVWASMSFADNATEDSAFLILPSGVITTQAVSQTPAMAVQGYVLNQLAVHGITPEQYISLDAPLQRQVMMPGRSMVLSREQSRQIVPKRIAVPSTIMQTLTLGNTLDTHVIEKFGVGIPTMQSMKNHDGMTLTPILFGNTLVMLNHEGRILGVTSHMF